MFPSSGISFSTLDGWFKKTRYLTCLKISSLEFCPPADSVGQVALDIDFQQKGESHYLQSQKSKSYSLDFKTNFKVTILTEKSLKSDFLSLSYEDSVHRFRNNFQISVEDSKYRWNLAGVRI